MLLVWKLQGRCSRLSRLETDAFHDLMIYDKRGSSRISRYTDGQYPTASLQVPRFPPSDMRPNMKQDIHLIAKCISSPGPSPRYQPLNTTYYDTLQPSLSFPMSCLFWSRTLAQAGTRGNRFRVWLVWMVDLYVLSDSLVTAVTSELALPRHLKITGTDECNKTWANTMEDNLGVRSSHALLLKESEVYLCLVQTWPWTI